VNDTKLLLGIWASGTTSIDKELNVLQQAIKQYGNMLTNFVISILFGSKDLYYVFHCRKKQGT
jgi:glucan endo-1,3-beta-D-glucosidase